MHGVGWIRKIVRNTHIKMQTKMRLRSKHAVFVCKTHVWHMHQPTTSNVSFVVHVCRRVVWHVRVCVSAAQSRFRQNYSPTVFSAMRACLMNRTHRMAAPIHSVRTTYQLFWMQCVAASERRLAHIRRNSLSFSAKTEQCWNTVEM